MTLVLGVDPGNVESAYALINADTKRPVTPVCVGKTDNADLLAKIKLGSLDADVVGIEMIASYGMAVGREVFETCLWIGRFVERSPVPPRLVYRRDIKLHHCHSAKAKDANITQALIDRFASGAPNRGKGTKVSPGWFYGFSGDVWQAYAVAVYVADTLDTKARTA